MNATPHSPTARPRPKTKRNELDAPVSDMAHELLVRIIAGLATVVDLEQRDREVLYHYLYGRDAGQVAAVLELRETTVDECLHRVYMRTRTETRRALLEIGRDLAERRVEEGWRHAV